MIFPLFNELNTIWIFIPFVKVGAGAKILGIFDLYYSTLCFSQHAMRNLLGSIIPIWLDQRAHPCLFTEQSHIYYLRQLDIVTFPFKNLSLKGFNQLKGFPVSYFNPKSRPNYLYRVTQKERTFSDVLGFGQFWKITFSDHHKHFGKFGTLMDWRNCFDSKLFWQIQPCHGAGLYISLDNLPFWADPE